MGQTFSIEDVEFVKAAPSTAPPAIEDVEFVKATNSNPNQVTIGPQDESNLERAWDVFKTKMQRGNMAPYALGSAVLEFPAIRAARNSISPLLGSTEEEAKNLESIGATPDEGVLPKLIRSTSRIKEVADFANQFRQEPKPDDPWNISFNKAAANVALDIGVGMLSPLGVASMMLTPTRAVQASSPFVLNAVNEASKAVVGDDDLPAQTQIERGLIATLGVGGTAAALRAGIGPKPAQGTRTTSTPKTPEAAIALEGETAAPRLAAELGVKTPLTAAQQTGAPGLASWESFYRRLGSGFTSLPTKIERAQRMVREKMSEIMSKRGGSVTAAGKAAARELTEGERLAARESSEAAGEAAGVVGRAAEEELASFTASPEELTTMGDEVRGAMKLVTDFDASRGKRLFAERDQAIAEAIGDINKPFIKPTVAANEAKTILGEAAKREVPGEPSLVLDASGQLIPGEPVRQVMPEFLPSFNRIKSISTWDTPQTLLEITAAKNEIGSAIGRMTEGSMDQFGGGLTLAHLKRLYGALSDDIDIALEPLGPKVKQTAAAAKAAHKRGIELRQQSPVIAKILTDPDKGGISNTADIVTQFASGNGSLNDLLAVKQVIPEMTYQGLRRGIVDSLQGQATIPTSKGGLVDLTVLRKNLDRLTPEFQRELLGSDKNVTAFKDTLDRFGVAKEGVETIGGITSATPDQLAAFIRKVQEGKSTAGAKELGRAISLEGKRSRNYYNSVTKNIRENRLGEVEIDEGRFVDDFIFNAETPEEVLAGLQQLKPATREAVQNAAAKRLFERAVSVDEATLKQLTGDTGVPVDNAKLIELVIKDPTRRAIMDAVIPEGSKQLISDYLSYMRTIEQAYKQGGDSGLVSAQSRMGGSTGSPVSLVQGALNSLVRMRSARILSDIVFSGPVQRRLAYIARNDKWIPTGLIAEALETAQGWGSRPWRDSTPQQKDALIRSMSNYLPIGAVQQWVAGMEALDAEEKDLGDKEREDVELAIPIPGL